MSDLIPVGWFIFVVNQVYVGEVTGRFDDSVTGVDGGTVMYEKEGAKEASLQCTSGND